MNLHDLLGKSRIRRPNLSLCPGAINSKNLSPFGEKTTTLRRLQLLRRRFCKNGYVNQKPKKKKATTQVGDSSKTGLLSNLGNRGCSASSSTVEDGVYPSKKISHQKKWGRRALLKRDRENCFRGDDFYPVGVQVKVGKCCEGHQGS